MQTTLHLFLRKRDRMKNKLTITHDRLSLKVQTDTMDFRVSITRSGERFSAGGINQEQMDYAVKRVMPVLDTKDTDYKTIFEGLKVKADAAEDFKGWLLSL